MSHIRSVTAITRPYPDGQKFDAVAIEYDTAIDAGSIDAAGFEVAGRKILGAAAGVLPGENRGNTGKCREDEAGRIVILKLAPDDAGAARVFTEIPEKGREGAGPGKGPEPSGTPRNLPPMRIIRPDAEVIQKGILLSRTGDEICPDGLVHPVDGIREILVDDFIQGSFMHLGYDLYVPEDSGKGGKQPLVVFIHDAGVNGEDPKLTLLQGNGATGFADTEIQSVQSCFVLAPQIPRGELLTTDEFTCSPLLEEVRKLIDCIADEYPVDRKRILITGQSQGCMAACELNARYPGLFAASLLVAGQWDPERMGQTCPSENFWIFVSDGDRKAFPGMTAMTEALRRHDAKTGVFYLNAHDPAALQEEALKEQEQDGMNIRMTVFKDHSVVPQGIDDDPGTNHIFTWPAVYALKEPKMWLLRQHAE